MGHDQTRGQSKMQQASPFPLWEDKECWAKLRVFKQKKHMDKKDMSSLEVKIISCDSSK